MPGHDIIVIGASAGGVQALSRLVELLPDDFPAAVFIVLHTSPDGPGLLPSVLSKAGRLRALSPDDKSKIEPGRIYVAPPDHHLLVERERIRVVRGPKENRHRPAIDPLFRSAAFAFGPRVVGIVLTGLLDDGTAGLWAVKNCNGIAVVQDPSEAIFPDMPLNALRSVEVDYTLPVADIAALAIKLAREPAPKGEHRVPDKLKLETEFVMMERDIGDMGALGKPSAFTCPSCRGALWELREGNLLRYRCHVGHAYSSQTLLAEQSEALETALYSALRATEEKAAALRRIASMFDDKMPKQKASYETKATEHDQSADMIRRLLAGKNADRLSRGNHRVQQRPVNTFGVSGQSARDNRR
jgi:two-component system chemotaxis response regulator CheB